MVFSDTSVKKNAGPAINKEVELLCREMAQRLDHQYFVQLSQPLPPRLPNTAHTSI